MLQWVGTPREVVAELVRVIRPGGRIALIHFDWFSFGNWPELEPQQQAIEQWMLRDARDHLGFDAIIGRKQAAFLKDAGATDITVRAELDKAFGGFGRLSPAQREN